MGGLVNHVACQSAEEGSALANTYLQNVREHTLYYLQEHYQQQSARYERLFKQSAARSTTSFGKQNFVRQRFITLFFMNPNWFE